MSPRFKRLRVAGIVVAAVVAVPAIASALPVIDLPFEATYTGCLKPSGEINKVAQGENPKSACNDNDKEIHISGGDITAVNTSNGLTGGSLTGPANLQIAPSFRLPQACSNSAIPRWNGNSWTCGTDTGGGVHTSTIGLGDIVAAGPTDNCIDGDAFTGVTENTASTQALQFSLPAGKWRPMTTGDTRWYMNKTSDLFDGETFAMGFVKMEIVKNTNGNQSVVSTWIRGEAENLDGGGMPYDQDFGSFTTDGTSQIILRATAHGKACTTARLLAPTIEFMKVG
ncbi:MAG: hypothetical protein ABWZ15_13930 [Acidimicrobiia bacterium]